MGTGGGANLALKALALFLVALTLRCIVVLGTEVPGPLRADAGQYFAYAYNLRYHHVYGRDVAGLQGQAPVPDSFRNPGYPLMIAPLIGEQPDRGTLTQIQLFQAFWGALVVVMVFLGMNTMFPGWPAFAAAGLTLLSPHLAQINTYILSESAAALTLVGFWWYATRRQLLPGKPGDFLILGCLLGLMTLVRPTMAWFWLPLAGLVWFNRGAESPRKAWMAVLGLVLGYGLLMAPWWIRNLVQFGHTSDPALMLATLHHGMYPQFTFEGHPESYGFPYRFDPRAAEITASLSSLLEEIFRRFHDEPWRHLSWYLLEKPLVFWQWSNNAQGAGQFFIYEVSKTPYDSNPILNISALGMFWLHWPIVILGLASNVLAWVKSLTRQLGTPQRLAWQLLAVLHLYFLAVHIVGAPFPRYAMPVLPLLYAQAMIALYVLRQAFVKKGAPPDAASPLP